MIVAATHSTGWARLGGCLSGIGLSVWLLAGCAVGPDYHRPAVATPAGFRGAPPASSADSLANLPWWQVFGDEALQQLIHAAVTNNYDLRVAITRVEQARAAAAQARAQYLPQLDYALLGGHGKNVANNLPSPTGTEGTLFAGDGSATWELDLWGQVRRLNEAARAQFLASQETRRNVLISLIAQVAQDYFQLLALDQQLEVARQSTNSFGASLRIFQERLQGGVASKLETASAEALLEAAAATIPELEQQIILQENQLSLLLGQPPGEVRRGHMPLAQQLPPAVPAGLPSALLERRPDLRAAEQQLRAANAQVGVAKANFFPQFKLTGLLGGASTELSAFASGGTVAAWEVAAGLTGPIFHGGQLRAQYAAARAAREQAALQYQAAVLNALQEISSALSAREKLAAAAVRQDRAVEAYQTAVTIAQERYRLGHADYYEVLQEQQLLFPAENAQIQLQLNQLLAVVQLYRGLGGGWEQEPATDPSR